MNISINQIESGIALLIEGQVYVVEEYHHVKPAKGSAFVRVRLRNFKTDNMIEKTFRTAETLETIPMEENRMDFLYSDGDTYHFMDHETYEQEALSKQMMGDGVRFLKENLQVTGICYDGKVQKIILPNFITAEITATEPGFKGDSTKSSGKPATIDTGANILVPLFINVGDWVKIDTRSGTYVERVQK